MKSKSYLPYSYCFLFALQAAVNAAEVPKANNSTALNDAASWVPLAVPTAADIAVWDATITNTWTSAGLPALGGDLTLGGIKVGAVQGALNAAQSGVGFLNDGAANTVTLGAGGVDMSAATQPFLFTSRLVLSADQTWNINNAHTSGAQGDNGGASVFGLSNGEDFAVRLVNNAPISLGGFTLTKSGVGNLLFSGHHTFSNGTVVNTDGGFTIQSSVSQNAIVGSDVTVQANGGVFMLKAFSGNGAAPAFSVTSGASISVNPGGTVTLLTHNGDRGVEQTGPITLNGGTLNQQIGGGGGLRISGGINVAANSTWTTAGGAANALGLGFTGNLTGANTLTIVANNTATGTASPLAFSGDNSGFTGSIVIGGTGANSLRLASNTAGSAAASWTLNAGRTLQVHGVDVSFGTLNGSGNGIITNSGAAAGSITVGAGTFAGPITDGTGTATLGLTKVGAGTFSLTGTADNVETSTFYSGPTNVNAGKLVLHAGADLSASTVTVADGATLSVVADALDNDETEIDLLKVESGGTFEINLGGNPNRTTAAAIAGSVEFSAGSKIRVVGSNLTAGQVFLFEGFEVGGIPIGTVPLELPSRTVGTLEYDDTFGWATLNITSAERLKWTGSTDGDWDINGKTNWAVTGGPATPTTYLQSAAATDNVLFDDTATGTGTINLTTTALAPLGVTVQNSAKAYTFTGIGKLGGSTSLSKRGSGTLTLANSVAYDYTGGTQVHEGTLRLGDGVTDGVGLLPAHINVGPSATLEFNHAGDFTHTGTISGTAEGVGKVVKSQGNTLTFSAGINTGAAFELNAGSVRFANGGGLGGAISGSAPLEVTGGTLTLSGTAANTNSGITTVSAGILALNKLDGENVVNAVGGNITITGSGVVNLQQPNQIPDDATVLVTASTPGAAGVDAGVFPTSNSAETFKDLIVSAGADNIQVPFRNNLTVSGTATLNRGIIVVPSNHSGTINKLVIERAESAHTALVRIAGNSAASILNVGAGGIEVDGGGTIQVKHLTGGDWDAVLNLAGDIVTTGTGDLTISNAGYTGTALNRVVLSGNRVFNIGSGTTTSIAADLISPETTGGTLTKTGGGTLVLTGQSNSNIFSGTTVTEGSFVVNGPLTGTVDVAASATLGGAGTLASPATVAGTVAPGPVGNASGILTSTSSVTFSSAADLSIGIADWDPAVDVVGSDRLNAATLVFNATPSNKLKITVGGTTANFTETNKTIVVASATTSLTGLTTDSIEVVDNFVGTGTWTAAVVDNTVVLTYAAGEGSADPFDAWATANGIPGAAKTGDADGDGQSNLLEFALDSNPQSGAASGKVVGKIASVGGQQVLTLTLPVRNGSTTFAGTTELSAIRDGITYKIQSSDDLATWNLDVDEVFGTDAATIQAGLPALNTGWTYHTFRSPGPVTGDPKEFIRAVIE